MSTSTDQRDAILFDLDGTLSDPYVGISRSLCHALDAMGFGSPDEAGLRACIGPPLRGSFARIMGTDDSERIERAVELYRERYREHGMYENVLYPGIAETLELLGRTHRLFVATSKARYFAVEIVEHFGIAPFFEHVYGSEPDGRLENKVELVAHVVDERGLDRRRSTMIGDRMHDIRGGTVNGLRTIGVTWGYGSREELHEAGAHRIVDSPAEIATVMHDTA